MIISLSLSNYTYAETTENLISNNFLDGSWTDNGTGQLNSMHGSSTVAGIHGGEVQTTISLNESGINKGSLNNGFTSDQVSNIYIWNGEPQSVTQTQILIDDRGNSVTQSTTCTSTCTNSSNKITIGENTASDYSITAKWTVSVPSKPTYHYGADINTVGLYISYTYSPDLSVEQTAALNNSKEDLNNIDASLLTEEYKQSIGVTYKNSLTGEDYGVVDASLINTKESKSTVNETKTETTETVTASKEESTKTVDNKTETKEETKNETSKEATETNTEESSESSEANIQDTKTTVSSSKEVKVNNITNTNIAPINVEFVAMFNEDQQTLASMVNNELMDEYKKIPFYKEREFYTNQVNIFDNRVLYSDVNLNSYTNSDPLNIKWRAIQENKLKLQKLKAELAVLKGRL